MTPPPSPRHASACWHPRLSGREMKARTSFLKKSSKKLLLLRTALVSPPPAQITKSFLLLFFKKEVLPFSLPK
jgi:hypothetical protein